jgi:predicted nuclease with TOPRIM domain
VDYKPIINCTEAKQKLKEKQDENMYNLSILFVMCQNNKNGNEHGKRLEVKSTYLERETERVGGNVSNIRL